MLSAFSVVRGARPRAAAGCGRGFAFIPVYDLNLLDFRSGPERAEMTLRVKIHPW